MMKYPAAWLIGIVLLVTLLVRRHMTVALLATVLFVVVFQLGAFGLLMIWPTWLALALARRRAAPRPTWQ